MSNTSIQNPPSLHPPPSQTQEQKKTVLTPPVPESCKWLNPGILLPSDAKPPCNSSPSVSATAFAIENGRLAPAKTCPPLIVPMRGSTKLKMLVALCCALEEGSAMAVEARARAREVRGRRRERAMAARVWLMAFVYCTGGNVEGTRTGRRGRSKKQAGSAHNISPYLQCYLHHLLISPTTQPCSVRFSPHAARRWCRRPCIIAYLNPNQRSRTRVESCPAVVCVER